jgi:hypothetical protein
MGMEFNRQQRIKMANKEHSQTKFTDFDTPDCLQEILIGIQDEFDCQPSVIQRYFETQASSIADILLSQQSQIRFSLPDRINLADPKNKTENLQTISTDQREYTVGGVLDKWIGPDLRTNLRMKLTELEEVNNPAISLAARLLRYTVSYHLVYNILPSGRSITYETLEGEELPTEPAKYTIPSSAITQESDAIAESGDTDSKRGELQSPYVPAALRFFMPQWVAFDSDANLIARNVTEAEGHINAMQKYLSILHMAVGLSPYFVSDPVYSQKRYGILGQLVNQARLFAQYQIEEIISEIKRRSENNSLNRGLNLSFPYFDDRDLSIKLQRFEVIPAGRIMFVPAFVVRASREEQAKVVQDTRLSHSTKKYLLKELHMLETAFNLPKENRQQ